jgi:hypothetical protein
MFARFQASRASSPLVWAALAVAAFGQQPRHDVLVGAALTPGFGMGVNSSGNNTSWLETEGDHLKMSYPSGQSWGAVFITVGPPAEPPRPFLDLSAYNVLAIEMKGAKGGERLGIGIKTSKQPDDGSETKIPVELTSDWKTYQFPLDRFKRADPHNLYVVTEFVFVGSNAVTVSARNISYSAVSK